MSLKPYHSTKVDFTLEGDVPSKKNSRMLILNGRRPYSIPSANHKRWHDEQMLVLKDHRMKRLWIGKGLPCKLWMTFHPGNKRRSDLTNKAESVADLLVDAGILDDDNWWQVHEVHLVRGDMDRKNPRVEIALFL